MGDPPKQHQTDFSLLYEEAHASVPLLDDAGKRLVQSMADFDPALRGVTFQQGPVKAFDRAAAKLINESTGTLDPSKASEIIDLVRGRIVVDTPEQVQAVRKYLQAHASELGIVSFKDRFAKPSDTHYRDINMSIQLENGHIAEIQINQKDMLAASEFTHDAYEELAKIERKAQLENRPLTDTEAQRRAELRNFVRDVHDRGAARVPNLDSLLNADGQKKLDKDTQLRALRDPKYERGKTLSTKDAEGQTHKYGKIVEQNPDFIDQAVVRGKDAYKEMSKRAGVEVDRLEISQEQLAQLRKPRIHWDPQTRQLVATSPDVIKELNLSPERYSKSGVGIKVETVGQGDLTRTFTQAGSVPEGTPAETDPTIKPKPQTTGDTALPVAAEPAVTGNAVEGGQPKPLTGGANQPETLGTRTSVEEGTAPKPTATDAGDSPSVALVRTGHGEGEDQGTKRSRWTQAVADAGGGKVVAAHIVTKAGYGLSAFHLSQQLFGENSTLKSDLKNDDVRNRAIAAVALDATVFTANTVEHVAEGAKYLKYLKNLDKLDDLARVASNASKISKFSKFAGPVGTAVTIVTTGLEYSIAETLEDGSRAARAIGGGAGGIGGGIIFGVIGFCIAGPPGAAIGAGIGGVGGGFGGAALSDKLFAEEFQENFDDDAIARQKKNLSKLEGLGNNLENFVEREKALTEAYKRLDDLYTQTNTKGKDHTAVLAINGRTMGHLDLAMTGYREARLGLSSLVESSMLTQEDIRTLESVNEFVQKRLQFLDFKEQHLREAGDQAALSRLAEDRKGLKQAAENIGRWLSVNDAIKENYGKDNADARQRADKDISTLEQAVSERKSHLHDYQTRILKHQAAVEQNSFQKSLSQRLEKVNTTYNSGETDRQLMQRNAALLQLVESGQLDESTLKDAKAEISALQARHGKELSEMTAQQAKFASLSRVERTHCSDPYKKQYANQNLASLKAISSRITELTDSHKVTQEITGHAIKAAESGAALHTLVESGQELSGSPAAIASGHIATIAEEQVAIIGLLSKDLTSTAQRLHGEWSQLGTRDIVDVSRYIELRDQSVRIREGIVGKLSEIEAARQTVQETLDKGYRLGDKHLPVTDEAARARLEALVLRLDALKNEYSTQAESVRTDIEQATQNLNSRVIERDEATLTLDRKGQVATYTAGEKTIVFPARSRPLLVDQNANIYNSTTSLKASDTAFYLYGNGVVTAVGEVYQGTRSQDTRQLTAIRDAQERTQVKEMEQELVQKLRGKSIKDAVSEVPRPPETEPPTPHAENLDTGAAETPEDEADMVAFENGECVFEGDPDYIEAAITLEKLKMGETLDDMESLSLHEFLESDKTSPEKLARIREQYAGVLAVFEQTEEESAGGRSATYAQYAQNSRAVNSAPVA
ncbi:MAG: hypothetical protein KA099_04105 [Alphaproteobacteria bacterium]|nr:hypothetical protein [Alphaproteobacteria bacterium]MBP7904491.1 hypothetical protein [Alphaproteobacteria bacterium]